jgi:HEAT repeat protein
MANLELTPQEQDAYVAQVVLTTLITQHVLEHPDQLEASNDLLAVLENDNPDIRAAALNQILVNALKHPDPIIRRTALENLPVPEDSPDITEQLLAVLENDLDPSVRKQVLVVLFDLRTQPGVLAAIEKTAQEDPEQSVREVAEGVIITNLKYSATESELLEALQTNPDKLVRRTALVVLWGSSRMQPHVVAVIEKVSQEDPEPSIQKLAQEWLAKNREQSATSVNLETMVNQRQI